MFAGRARPHPRDMTRGARLAIALAVIASGACVPSVPMTLPPRPATVPSPAVDSALIARSGTPAILPAGSRLGTFRVDLSTRVTCEGDLLIDKPVEVRPGSVLTIRAAGAITMASGASVVGGGTLRIERPVAVETAPDT